MKTWLLPCLLPLPLGILGLAEDRPNPIAPEAAAKMINSQVVVEMELKSAPLRQEVCSLNAREHHCDAANFTA